MRVAFATKPEIGLVKKSQGSTVLMPKLKKLKKLNKIIRVKLNKKRILNGEGNLPLNDIF
jgi:dihydropteroate synthase